MLNQNLVAQDFARQHAARRARIDAPRTVAERTKRVAFQPSLEARYALRGLPIPERQTVRQVSTGPDANQHLVVYLLHKLECLNETPKNQGPSVAMIVRAVSAFSGVSLNEIVSPRRQKGLVKARQVAMYLARKLTTRSLPAIGKSIGGRDHTTIIHGCRKIEQAIASGDEETIELLKVVEAVVLESVVGRA